MTSCQLQDEVRKLRKAVKAAAATSTNLKAALDKAEAAQSKAYASQKECQLAAEAAVAQLMLDLDAARGREHAKQDQLQSRIKELQTELAQMHQQSQKSQAIATAEDAFAKGGLPDLLYNLARATNKGHLQPTDFIAQHLKSIGYNLCQDSTNTWRFSWQERSFYSLLLKTSRAAHTFLRGPMSAGGLPGDNRVSTALFNDIVPSRQALQQHDEQLAADHSFMNTGVNMAEIKRLADKLPAGQLNEACLSCDATDCAPKITIRSEQQRVKWDGQHDLSSTGIADKYDQTPYIAQHQQLCRPLLQGLEEPGDISIKAVHEGLMRWLSQCWCSPMGTLLQTYGEQVLPPDVPGSTKGICSSTRYMLMQV